MGINLSESEWCRKATPEVPCRTQGFSHVRHPLSQVIRLGPRNPRQKERKN